jgi:hypothetical protein
MGQLMVVPVCVIMVMMMRMQMYYGGRRSCLGHVLWNVHRAIAMIRQASAIWK